MRVFTFKLNEQMAQVVLNGLAELPFKVSAATVQEIMNQVNAQSKDKAEVAKEDKEAEKE